VAFSSFNGSYERNPLPPLLTLGQNLPRTIEEPSYEDRIEEGDSDEENLNELPVDGGLKLI
jgi:hypothetical protein